MRRRERAGISEKFLSYGEGLSLRNVKLLALNVRDDVKSFIYKDNFGTRAMLILIYLFLVNIKIMTMLYQNFMLYRLARCILVNSSRRSQL